MVQRVLLFCLLFCTSFWRTFTNAAPFHLELQVPNIINPFRIRKPFRNLWSHLTFKQKVIASLQDEILILERQLRKSKQETSQLRTLLQHQQQTRRRGDSTQVLQSVQVVNTLKEELKLLTQQCTEMEKTKIRLEKVLKEEEKRYELLQEEMEALKQNHEEQLHQVQMEEEAKLECVRKDLLEKAKQQVATVQEQHSVDIQKEIKKIQIESEKAMQRKQEKLQQMTKLYNQSQAALQIKEKEAEADLAKLRKEVQAERKRGEEAVEKEKIKMRKLVKALAAKEKKELDAMKKKNKADVSGGRTGRATGSQRTNVSIRAGKRTKH